MHGCNLLYWVQTFILIAIALFYVAFLATEEDYRALYD